MKTPGIIWAALLCTLALSQPAFSQSAAPDADLATSVAAAQQLYAASFPAHSQLYSGPEYVDYAKRYRTSTGHQFFALPTRQPGSVYYNDHYFSNLQLAYDEVLEQVVLGLPNSPLTLRLINENVRYFTINGHRFARVVADSATARTIRTGYYEVLVDSTVQVLAKRMKRMQEHIEQHDTNVQFTDVDKFFIKKDGRYYPVSSKSAVMRVFADHSQEVQKYVREHKLKFGKKERVAAVVELATYYSGLPAH
ncbi:MAG: hypothetical protein JWP58_23 [Hymenobacter sp.]|nr:hypothetical protein [Hymenobacter sp.]